MSESNTTIRYKGSTGLFAQPLEGILEKVTAPAFRKHGYLKARLLACWPDIIGAEIATSCRPLRLNFPQQQSINGILVLKVARGHAPAIQHMEPIILEKIAIYFGYRAINRIRLEQA